MTGPCIFEPCVATWRHWHGGFPGGYDDPADPDGAPIDFEGDDPEPGAVRDYNGAPLRPGTAEGLTSDPYPPARSDALSLSAVGREPDPASRIGRQ